MKTAVVYLRKSTNETWKQDQSIETQLAWCHNYCENNNFTVIDTIIETQSASKLWRWWFEKLIEMFEKWEAEYLVAHHIDRISRNPVDEWSIKWLAQRRKIIEIHSSEWIFNWQQILLLSLHLAMANQYTNDLSQKVKEGIATKLSNGGVVGATPVWYINNRETKQAEVDDNTAFLIVEIFKLRAKWYSASSITVKMNWLWLTTKKTKKKTPTKIAKSTIEDILKNPFYYWIIKYNWELYEWKHKPIISKELYDRANNINRWIIYIRDREISPLRWIIKYLDTWDTLCASLIKKKYVFFHLHSSKWKFWYNQREIINYFDENIHLYSIPANYIWDIKEWLSEKYLEEIEKNKDKKSFLSKKITILENEKPWLIKMRSKWEIESEEFATEKNRIVNEISNLKFEIEKIDNQDSIILDDLNNSVELYVELLAKRKTLNDAQKALLISKMTVELFVDKEKRLYIEEKPLFKTLRIVNLELQSELEVNPVQWSNFIYNLYIEWKTFINIIKNLKEKILI